MYLGYYKDTSIVHLWEPNEAVDSTLPSDVASALCQIQTKHIEIWVCFNVFKFKLMNKIRAETRLCGFKPHKTFPCDFFFYV